MSAVRSCAVVGSSVRVGNGALAGGGGFGGRLRTLRARALPMDFAFWPEVLVRTMTVRSSAGNS